MFLLYSLHKMGVKLIVHLISIILVILVVIGISTSNIIDEFKPILIENNEKITASININAEDNTLAFSGWNSYLITKDEKVQRFLGPKERNVSYFFNEEDSKKIEENKVFWYNETKDPKEIGYLIDNSQFKPYLKLQMFAKTERELEKVGYGFILRGFNLYLPNETLLENDYSNIDGNLTGTNHKNEVKYEIFYNEKDAIIIAGDFDYIDNLFRWEVFMPIISKHENNIFSPLYIIYIKDVKELKYEDNTWMINSKQFTGKVEDYIEKVKRELDSQ